MNDDVLSSLVDELREGFQIPFFYSDLAIVQDLKEGNAYLESLVSDVDYEKDLVARTILKNYAFYSFNNRVDDFKENYSSMILQWQFSKLKVVDDDETI